MYIADTMSIDVVMDQLFAEPKAVHKGGTSVNPTNELKKLQQQMRQYAVDTRKTYKPVFNFSENETDMTGLDTLLNIEIEKCRSKKGFKALPKSMKWDLVCKFLDTEEMKVHHTVAELDKLRAMLRKSISAGKDMGVQYDNESREITHIGILDAMVS